MDKNFIVFAAMLVSGIGCRDDVNAPPPEDAPGVVVSVSASSSRFSAANPTTLSVTVVNQSTTSVSFGYGSGSCWGLRIAAFHEGANRDLGIGGVCTTDYTLRSLKPGEFHTELFHVDGVLTRYPYRTIEPGIYEIHGRIAETSSDPLWIEYYDDGAEP